MIFTTNQLVLLLIVLALGLVLGLMLSGRGKYKRLWREERSARQQEKEEREAIAAAAERRRAEEPPLPTRQGYAQITTADVRRDDLTRISTLSTLDQRELNEAGYHSYEQIATMSDEQQASLESRLGRKPGSITHDQWREQARQLANEHAR